MQIIRMLRVATMVALLSCSGTTFAADDALQIESKIPTTLSGTLGYASLQYWIEVPGKGNVELLTDADDEGGLIELVGKQVSLNGAMVTYSNGSVYFEPKFSAPTSPGLSISQQDDGTIEVANGEQVLLSTDMYHSITIKHEQPLAQGKAVLLELNTGGVACPVLYQLAVIRSDALPLLTPTFGTCSDLGKLKHDTNGFTLALPGNPAETWAWDSRTLTLHK